MTHTRVSAVLIRRLAFGEVAKALGNGRRGRLVDVLAQGERHVDDLAAEIGQSLANTSFHLRVLAAAGVVTTRPRRGPGIYYRLTSARVGELWAALRDVAAAHHEQLDELAAAYLGDRRPARADRSGRAGRTNHRRRRRRYRCSPRRRVRGRPHLRSPIDPDRRTRRQHQEPARRDRGRRLLPGPVLRVRRRRCSTSPPTRTRCRDASKTATPNGSAPTCPPRRAAAS